MTITPPTVYRKVFSGFASFPKGKMAQKRLTKKNLIQNEMLVSRQGYWPTDNEP
jgi:hypothetical protein